MKTSLIIPSTSTQFVSNSVTKRLASFVVHLYEKKYKNVNWKNCPILETTCNFQALSITCDVLVPKDAYTMNIGFLEAIKRMDSDFSLSEEIETWEQMLLDLPFEFVDKMKTIDYLEKA